MLDPEVKPSPAREIAHKGKGCLAVLLSLAVLIFGGYFVYDRASGFLADFGEVPDYTGAGEGQVTVMIPEGSSLDAIGGLLVEQGVVRSTKAWSQAVDSEARATSVQPGRYLMKKEMPAIDALRLLINPGESRVRSQFTIQEGLRLSEQVEVLAKSTKISKKAFTNALEKPKALGLPAYADGEPEGFLFPETYELTANATATSTLSQMVTEYKAVAADIDLEGSAKKLGVEPLDVVIVASIIEREVRSDRYRAKVARVLYNRLEKDRKLELDSTVIYAEDLTTNTTTKKDRKSRSKYNTYRYTGLPPGPISAPGRAALTAAARPEKGDWLYFVTVNFETGETGFGKTEAEFEKLRAQFQEYCQDNPGTCDS
jgi:UPF0755 protein